MDATRNRNAADVQWWGGVFEACRPMMQRVVGRRVADPFLAEDVLQDAFARAWRNRSSFDPSRPVEPWLAAIAGRAAADALERASLRRERPVDIASLHTPAPDTSDDILARRERAAVVIDALAGLGDRDRHVLQLADWDGLRAREASTVLGMSYHAFTSALGRARARFRRVYVERAGARGLLGVAWPLPVARLRARSARLAPIASAVEAAAGPALAAAAAFAVGVSAQLAVQGAWPQERPSTVVATAPASQAAPSPTPPAAAAPPAAARQPGERPGPRPPAAGAIEGSSERLAAGVQVEAPAPTGNAASGEGGVVIRCREDSQVSAAVCRVRAALPPAG